MAIESKHHRPPSVDHVLVSEATRRDAQPASPPRFETYDEERDHLLHKKRQIESKLSGYSQAAFAGAQARIRRENREDSTASFDAWISCKASMETKRQALIREKAGVEEEIMRLKPLVKAEKARKQDGLRKNGGALRTGPGQLDAFELFREDGSLSWDGVAAQILLELVEIRRLLSSGK